MLLRSGRMTTKSQRNRSSSSSNNNNVVNISTNNSSNNEQNQTNLPFEVSNEMVMGVSHANNNPINISGKNTICSQVQTTAIKTFLLQNNVVSTTSTPPFLIQDHGGMPPLSNKTNMPQLSLPMPQSQNAIPPIVVSRRPIGFLNLGATTILMMLTN